MGDVFVSSQWEHRSRSSMVRSLVIAATIVADKLATKRISRLNSELGLGTMNGCRRFFDPLFYLSLSVCVGFNKRDARIQKVLICSN